MREEAVGTIGQTGEEYSLLLERDYPVPIESVWNALVEPEKLECILNPTKPATQVVEQRRRQLASARVA